MTLVRHQNVPRVFLVHLSEVMGILVHQQSMARVILVHWSLGLVILVHWSLVLVILVHWSLVLVILVHCCVMLVILVHQKGTTDLLHTSLNLTQLRVISEVCLALLVLFSPW